MSELAIRVEALGKMYRIAPPEERANTMRDAIAHAARKSVHSVPKLFRRKARTETPENTVWALRDVSFEVDRGEVVGIIGSNGAGKSTVLKILSRITEPTTGEVEIRGRVGSLLEVGTGFHSELTGRENIYLNGAILGMPRVEIDRKFDEMVTFAEVARFIDTPVKHYSSGMYLRLAFAVAAHLEPEILVVDEVLAVGDAAFQRKCLGKMTEVAGEGRTIVFVSHDMDAIQRLCSRCIYLRRGEIAVEGPVRSVIADYLLGSDESPLPNQWIDLSAVGRTGAGGARFTRVRYSVAGRAEGKRLHPLDSVEFEMCIHSETARVVRSLAVYIRSSDGMKLINADTVSRGLELELEPGENFVRMSLEPIALTPGRYSVGLWLAELASGRSVLDHVDSAFQLELEADPVADLGVTPEQDGVVATRFEVRQGRSSRRDHW